MWHYSNETVKTLKKLDPPTARLICAWIDKNLVNCVNPRTQGKALVGNERGYWRYRVGTYRKITEINDEKVTICVIGIEKMSINSVIADMYIFTC